MRSDLRTAVDEMNRALALTLFFIAFPLIAILSAISAADVIAVSASGTELAATVTASSSHFWGNSVSFSYEADGKKTEKTNGFFYAGESFQAGDSVQAKVSGGSAYLLSLVPALLIHRLATFALSVFLVAISLVGMVRNWKRKLTEHERKRARSKQE